MLLTGCLCQNHRRIEMKITTTSMLPPMILQWFDNMLLSPDKYKKSDSFKIRLDQIHEYASKKLPPKSHGKWKELYKLREKFWEEHERAMEKEEKYEAALKDAPKVPNISNAGVAIRFKRVRS